MKKQKPKLKRENAELRRALHQRDALVAGIRLILAPYEGQVGTHYEGCESAHWRCALTKLLREVER